MIQLDLSDGRPIYEQIKEKVKFLILHGVLKPDEKIPSVREMAQTLTINPNTIQKAYRDLEAQGFIYSIRGKGSYVSRLDKATSIPRKEELLKAFNKVTLELKYLKVPKNELLNHLEQVYGKSQ